VHRWVVVPAGLAPIALIGGWTWAAAVQPSGYDPVRDTISALAARGATDRWFMTAALAVLGCCHLATAAGLAGAGARARALLALGGAATVAVAALPQPATGHLPAATIAFCCLTAWPFASRFGDRRLARGSGALLAGLLLWLGWSLGHGAALGLSERFTAGAQSLCPPALLLAEGYRARYRSGRRVRRRPAPQRGPGTG
jgi:hypothetical protein